MPPSSSKLQKAHFDSNMILFSKKTPFLVAFKNILFLYSKDPSIEINKSRLVCLHCCPLVANY